MYSTAYRFFENIRLLEGVPKNEHRLMAEQIYRDSGGYPREKVPWVKVPRRVDPIEDEWGRIIEEVPQGQFSTRKKR